MGLAELESENVDSAISLLEQLIQAPETAEVDRVYPATALARLGPAARATSTRILSRLAAGPDPIDTAQGENTHNRPEDQVWHRLHALHELMRLGSEGRGAANSLLLQLADESGLARLPRALALCMLTDIDRRHHIQAVGLLTAIADGHDGDSGWDRLRAIETLLRLTPDHTDQGIRLLQAVSADHGLRVWIRRQAVELSARFGPARRAEAGPRLITFASDEDADPWERAESAVALTEIDPDHRPRAVAILRELASGDHPADQVRQIAELLSPFGARPRAAAAHALRRIATDSAHSGHERRSAAEMMLWLGDSAIIDGLDLLSQLAVDVALSPLDQALSRCAITLVHPQRADAAGALTEIADDNAEPPHARRHAAKALIRLDEPAHVTTGMTALRALATGSDVESFEQAMALHALTNWDTTHYRAADALRRLDMAALNAGQRRQAAEALTDRCSGYRFAAITVLERMVDDPTATSSRRCQSAGSLTRALGIPGRIIPSLAPGILSYRGEEP